MRKFCIGFFEDVLDDVVDGDFEKDFEDIRALSLTEDVDDKDIEDIVSDPDLEEDDIVKDPDFDDDDFVEDVDEQDDVRLILLAVADVGIVAGLI